MLLKQKAGKNEDTEQLFKEAFKYLTLTKCY
jgi:hypothetical protein